MKSQYFHSLILFFAVIILAGCRKELSRGAGQSLESLKAREYQNKAIEFEAVGSTDSAFLYFSMAREHYEKASDSTGIIYVLLRMSEIQYHQGDFSEVQSNAVDALQYVGSQGQIYLPMIYNDLGRVYCQTENYDRAIDYYRKILDLSDNETYRITALNNIAYAHISNNEFEKANRILDSLASNIIIDSLALEARVHTNLGYSIFKSGIGDGKSQLIRGLEIREKINDNFGIVGSCILLSEVLAESDRASSIRYAERADRMASELQFPEDRLLALKLLSRYESPQRAQAYADKYFKFSDSLQSVRRAARSYFADVKYNFKREREEKLKSQAEAAQLKFSRLIWAISLGVLGICAAVIIHYIVKTSRKKRAKAVYDTEIRISNRLHDELANDLHQAMVFTESRDLTDIGNRNKLLDALDSLYRQARSISREHAEVNVEDFSERLRDLLSTYISSNQSVIPIGIDAVNWDALDNLKKVVFYRVVQELLVNMKKHSGASRAVFRFSSDGRRITLAYSDDGIGLRDDNLRKNGMAFMENRISAIGGNITFDPETGKGFRAKIEFPM